MPSKCIFIYVCENEDCENKIPCTRSATKNGLCRLHKKEIGAGGNLVDFEPHYGDKKNNWAVPQVDTNNGLHTNWLGLGTRIGGN